MKNSIYIRYTIPSILSLWKMLNLPDDTASARWFASLCKALDDANRLEKMTMSSHKIPGFSWPVQYVAEDIPADGDGGGEQVPLPQIHDGVRAEGGQQLRDNRAQFEEVDIADIRYQGTQYDKQETDIDTALKLAGVRNLH